MIIYFKSLNSIKIRETLNRYNFKDIDFRSTSRRSLEAWNFALWDAFLFIPIWLPIAKISSCKEKGNFWSFTISILVIYSDLSLAPRLTNLSQTPDEWQTRFLEVVGISRKKCRSLGRGSIHKFHTLKLLWILISRQPIEILR